MTRKTPPAIWTLISYHSSATAVSMANGSPTLSRNASARIGCNIPIRRREDSGKVAPGSKVICKSVVKAAEASSVRWVCTSGLRSIWSMISAISPATA